MRGVLPLMERFGVATTAELEPDTLAERLHNELRAANGIVISPPMVGALGHIYRSKSRTIAHAPNLARLWRDQGKEASSRTAGSGLRVVHGRVRDAGFEGGEGAAGGVGGVGLDSGRVARAMSMFHKTKATRPTPWLCATRCPYLHFLVYHSARSCLLGRGAVRRPRSSTRAPRGIFYCKPVSARMQRLAIGGGVTIGIVTYSC